MGVLLRDFLSHQIFGLNGLVNLSNFAFLLGFSVRDFLKLRILLLASDVLLLPYYYFQHEPLWPPIFWGVAFIIVNGIRIVTLTLDRRPVILSDKEEELHRVAFGSIDKRDFLKVASLARWVAFSPGEVIVKKGQQISDAIVLISGETEAVLSGKTILAYRLGQLIGNVSAYTWPRQSNGRGRAGGRTACHVGSGATEGVHREQAGTPRHTSAKYER